MRLLKRLFSGKSNEPSAATDSEQQDVLSSSVRQYKLVVAMDIDLPSRILARHGEVADSPLDDESQKYGGRAIWVPLPTNDILAATRDNEAGMASPMGPIHPSGGKLLPYLLKARRIIERPLSNTENEIAECLQRVEEIELLSAEDKTTSDQTYFQCNFYNRDRALLTVLKGLDITVPGSLLARHIKDAHSKGYKTVHSIVSAPDEELLAIKGIGKARLEKIRQGE
jgi:hypothetical protein